MVNVNACHGRHAYKEHIVSTDLDPSTRLDALESRVAFQDQTIEELNGTITEQWRLIDNLARRVATLEEQVRAGGFIADPRTEPPPPHY